MRKLPHIVFLFFIFISCSEEQYGFREKITVNKNSILPTEKIKPQLKTITKILSCDSVSQFIASNNVVASNSFNQKTVLKYARENFRKEIEKFKFENNKKIFVKHKYPNPEPDGKNRSSRAALFFSFCFLFVGAALLFSKSDSNIFGLAGVIAGLILLLIPLFQKVKRKRESRIEMQESLNGEQKKIYHTKRRKEGLVEIILSSFLLIGGFIILNSRASFFGLICALLGLIFLLSGLYKMTGDKNLKSKADKKTNDIPKKYPARIFALIGLYLIIFCIPVSFFLTALLFNYHDQTSMDIFILTTVILFSAGLTFLLIALGFAAMNASQKKQGEFSEIK